jgi:excisionase family DNA binding protein
MDTRLAYTVKETADLLGVSFKTVYRMIENGTIPHKRLDGRGKSGRGMFIIPAAALEKWLAKTDEPRDIAFKKKAEQIARDAVLKLAKKGGAGKQARAAGE